MKLLSTSKTLILLIIPFGPVPKETLNFLQTELTKVFNLDVRIARPNPVPQHAFDPKRGQYYSSRILEDLKTLKAKNELVLGIIDADLFVPELNKADIWISIGINGCHAFGRAIIEILYNVRNILHSFSIQKKRFIAMTHNRDAVFRNAVRHLGEADDRLSFKHK